MSERNGKRPGSTLDGWLTKRPCTPGSSTSSPPPLAAASLAGAAAVCQTTPSTAQVPAEQDLPHSPVPALSPPPQPLSPPAPTAAAPSPAAPAPPFLPPPPPPIIQAAAPCASSTSYALGGLVFVLAGFDESNAEDVSNEVRLAGGTVLHAFDPQRCTHLLIDEEMSGDVAAAESLRADAQAHGISIVDGRWLSDQTHDVNSETGGMNGATDVAPAFSDTPPPLAPLPPEALLPPDYVDAWDREHVRLPCSPRCVDSFGTPLWETLWRRLRPPPPTYMALMSALKAIQRALGKRGLVLDALHEFVNCDLSDAERSTFFECTLPHMCDLALELPTLCPQPLPLLLQGRAGRVELSPRLCASLLAHAFFCSMPMRNPDPGGGAARRPSGAPDLPYFSFAFLFGPLGPPRFVGSHMQSTQPHKLRCLLGYFEALAQREYPSAPAQPVAFERLVLDTSECDIDTFWSALDAPLCEVRASASGLIEESGEGMLQLDFANRVIGGGVLRSGSVQEEIRFLCSPELIVARLLCEAMQPHEALLLSSFERFSNHRGYARTFEYAGPYTAAASDASQRPQLLAIDATHYGRHDVLAQFAPHELERELNKALAGFSRPAHDPLYSHGGAGGAGGAIGGVCGTLEDEMDSPDACAPEGELRPLLPLCTGNWGCGAFGGDLQLKAMIQWAAASAAGRPLMTYLTFSDEALADSLTRLTARLRQNGCTVAQLVRLLARFQPRKWPHSPSARATGYYADLFRFLDGRCEREEARRREAAATAEPKAAENAEVAGAPMAEVALEATGSDLSAANAAAKVAEAAEAADAEATEVVTEATREATMAVTLAVPVPEEDDDTEADEEEEPTRVAVGVAVADEHGV